VRAIRPPTVPAGKARLRFSLTASIERSELDRLSGSLYEWRTRNLTPATWSGDEASLFYYGTDTAWERRCCRRFCARRWMRCIGSRFRRHA